MRTVLIVIDPPRLDLGMRILDRQELMDVEALVAQAPVKRLDVRIIHGFAGPREIELHATLEDQSSSAREVNSVP
jgi:hypothetical protein